ncbi:MAG TPA: hypothetical protein VMW08_16795 [Acidimicrobiales bacterium]|nr:hypothetical protein [Acidimicrobiales bacterium]
MAPQHLDLSHRVVEAMTTYPGLPGPIIATHLSRVTAGGHVRPLAPAGVPG